MNERAANRAPWWVTALDVACLVVLALMVRSWLGDNYRIIVTPEVRLSLRSWPRIALVLIALLAVRHLLWREIAWPSRVSGWLRAAWRWEPLRAAWGPFIVSRLLMLVVAYVAFSTIGLERPEWQAGVNAFVDLYARWDAGWYYGIASVGYPDDLVNFSRTSAIAFFPGLPLAMRATAVLLHVNLWSAGVVVVIVAFLLALIYVYRLACLDLPQDQARASVMFLAFYPFAFCYSAILTEGLFLMAAAAAFFHVRRHQPLRAALFALGVGLLRPNGFLLSAPLGLLALTELAAGRGWVRGPAAGRRGGLGTFAWQATVASLPLVGMIGYSLYARALTGNAFAWVEVQQAWGRESAAILKVIDARADLIGSSGVGAYLSEYTVEIIEALAALFALAAVWPIFRRFGLAYAVFVALAVIPPFVSMGSVSLGRYTAPLFPIFLWLGAVVPPERRPYWAAAFAAGQALLGALFFTWRPPY